MLEASQVCKQCGWDRRQDAPPSQDPGDKKARIGVAAGLLVAYGIMFSVASGAGTGSSPMRAAKPSETSAAPAYAPEPVTGEAIALGRLPSELPEPGAATKPGALITIKVADVKSATIPARDALQYLFSVPETEQKCALVGSTRGVGGFRDIEVFLLTDDEYIFWNA